MNPKSEDRLFIGTLFTVATLVGAAFYFDLTKERPEQQPESVTERVMRQYDLDGNLDNLNREELSNLLKDYQPIEKGE